MNRSVTGLCVHPLSEKPLILHFLSNKPTRDADLLSPDNNLQYADAVNNVLWTYSSDRLNRDCCVAVTLLYMHVPLAVRSASAWLGWMPNGRAYARGHRSPPSAFTETFSFDFMCFQIVNIGVSEGKVTTSVFRLHAHT